MKKTVLIMAFIMSVIATINAQSLSKSTLCKKWYLHHYEHMWIDYKPEKNEQNDYIQFNSDMTYISVDEGKKTNGKWSFNAKEKYILMYDEKGENVKLLVEDLDDDELVFEIDNNELKGVEIHYSSIKTKEK
jgi:hypothetical protein